MKRPAECLHSYLAVVVVIIGTIVANSRVARADWPQFRGPRGDGHVASDRLPTTWNALRNIAWETEIPGRGWSSPVVVGDRIWLTTAEQTALPENERSEKLAQHKYGDLDFQTHGSVVTYAVEIDARDGRLLRRIELLKVDAPVPIHAVNSYASPTPVADAERLYCHFGSLGTAALERTTGKISWRKRYAIEEITGPGGSPELWRDRLIIACDGVDEQFVVALAARTGEELWKSPRPQIAAEGKHRRAFSTPLAIDHGGRQQVVSVGAQWAVSYDPATGREWWRVNFGDGHAIVPRPVFHDGLLYFCTGYMKPQLWAVRVDGTGDVTESHVVWRTDRQVPEIASPIVVGDAIYFVSVLGIASCVDAKTGQLVWQKRLGGNYGASPIASGDRIYFTSQEGDTTIVKAGREYEELAKNHLNGLILASPAAHGAALLLRGSERLSCIRE